MKEVLVEGHNTTEHDGGVAVWNIEGDKIPVNLASERVSRKKHDGDSQTAYNYIKTKYAPNGYLFGSARDFFNPIYTEYQPLHHHLAHASSAFFPSDFNEAGVLVIDGQGGYGQSKACVSSSIWKGIGNEVNLLEMNKETDIAAQSIGHLYSSVSFYLGFGFLQEGKVMGLAAYGEMSDIYKFFRKYVQIQSDGHYQMHPKLLRAMLYLTEGRRFFKLEDSIPSPQSETLMEEVSATFGPPRKPNEPISKRDKDLAWAIQHLTEELVLGLAQRTKNLTGSENLCYAGGVALNSVANGKILETGLFKQMFILPAAGDEGQALGRLLYRAHQEMGLPRTYTMRNAYLGPEYQNEEIKEAIQRHKNRVDGIEMEEQDLLNRTVASLMDGNVVGWWQGRSEIGPRALGHRSLLTDPSGVSTRDYVNFQVKHREWFRPLAPSIMLEAVDDYFEQAVISPYMLIAANVRQDKINKIPATTHVDGSARLQTVTQEDNGLYYQLIRSFADKTGIPVLLNTSFNDAGDPIVESPEDAVQSLLKMNFHHLVIGNFFVTKKP